VPVIGDLQTIRGEGLTPLRAVLAGSAIKVFHHGKFDVKFLQQAGLSVHGLFFDTMLAAQLLNAGLQAKGFGLADLARDYTLRGLR